MHDAVRKREHVGVLYAVSSAAGFGFLGVLGALGRAEGLTSSTLLAWRFLCSALVLGGLYALRKGRPRFQLTPFLLGLVAYAAQSLLFFKTVEHIGAGKAAILLYTYPALVTLLGWLRHGHRPGGAHLIGLVLTTLGCLLVLDSSEGAFSLAGVVLGLSTALVYSIYLLASEQVLQGIDAMTSSFNVCLGTGLAMFLVSLARPQHLVPTTAAQWSVIAALVVICTVLPTLLLFGALRRIGSARAALCSTIEPLVAVVLGIVVFAEGFSRKQLIGGALVVSSIAVIYVLGSPRSRHPV